MAVDADPVYGSGFALQPKRIHVTACTVPYIVLVDGSLHFLFWSLGISCQQQYLINHVPVPVLKKTTPTFARCSLSGRAAEHRWHGGSCCPLHCWPAFLALGTGVQGCSESPIDRHDDGADCPHLLLPTCAAASRCCLQRWLCAAFALQHWMDRHRFSTPLPPFPG